MKRLLVILAILGCSLAALSWTGAWLSTPETKAAGTFVVAKQASLFEQGLSGGRTIEIEITGPELTRLVALGGQVFGMVSQLMPKAQVIPKPSLDLSNPELHVIPKWEQAADMNITAAELGYMVDALVDGDSAAADPPRD